MIAVAEKLTPATLLPFLLAFATVTSAESFSVRDLNPLLSGYEIPPALPSTQTSSTVLDAQWTISNTSLDQHSAQEALQLDAELQSWQFNFTQPLSHNLSLRIELPYLIVSGGSLDSFIESFHHSFGLANGNRSNWPRKRLWVHHQRFTDTDYLLGDATHGLGDLAMRIGWHLNTRPSFNNNLWLSLKLPTGNAGKLTGSGAVDLALTYSLSQQLSARFTTQQQISLSLLGQGKRLAAQHETLVWSGSLGINAIVTRHWSAVLQFDGHSRVFDSDLRVLGSALQLSFGPRYQSGAWQSYLSISEDIAVDTAPDVQFQLSVQRKF